jgi:nucleotide-binding universal stress UspA family protein
MLERELAAARQRIAGLGGVEPRVAYGEPAEELALYSRSVDLLVIDSRSYGPVGRLVHGSTAQKLARMTHFPLLVLTRAARKANGASSDERETTSATV